MKPDLSHEVELVAPFHDIDAMEVVWHGHYVKYLEIARTALLARLNYDFHQMRESGFAWPVVDLRLKYVRPARLGQALRVRAQIVEWENRLRIEYLIRDAATAHCLSKAWTIQVAVDIATGQMRYVCPPALWARLGVAP